LNPHDTEFYLTQGFIGADDAGNTVTLGREGSDFTAAIIAHCLEADSVTIWKDVPGVLNADPNKWEETSRYPVLSYGEASEMTYYGASVIHPKTIRPLAIKNIPLIVKSFKDPGSDGTYIAKSQHGALEPAIIFKPDQCLISFQVLDYSFINESKISLIFHLFEEFNIQVNMMQSSAISFSVCVDDPDENMKNIINSLSAEFDIFYNNGLELITVKNYHQELVDRIIRNREVLLAQKTRRNFQVLVTERP
jgi:aspartate kinase